MKKTAFALTALLCTALTSFAAEEFGTAAEAESMLTKAVKAINSNREGTITEINAKDKKWIDRDLYPTVYTLKGFCLANGANPKMAGKDMINLTDINGKEVVKERMAMAATKSKFIHELQYTDPVTKKVLPKEHHCEKADDLLVCVGTYKR